jgi:hypothetical protein
MEGWLCPALFKYFDRAPDRLYLRAEPLGGEDAVVTVPRSEVERLLNLLETGRVEEATALVAEALG